MAASTEVETAGAAAVAAVVVAWSRHGDNANFLGDTEYPSRASGTANKNTTPNRIASGSVDGWRSTRRVRLVDGLVAVDVSLVY